MKLDINYKLADVLRNGTNFVLLLVETLLAFRVVFKLFNAQVTNEFVSWIYDTSAPLIDPFEGMFATVRAEGLIIEPSTLFAMLVFAVLAFLVFALIDTFDVKRK